MSTPHPPETATCGYCDGPRDRHDSVQGSYCSERCYYRDKGAGLLAQLETDRRICSTCFGCVHEQLRLAYQSSEGEIEVVVQTPSDCAVRGVDEYAVADSAALSVKAERWSCQCGAVDPSEYHPEIQALDRDEARRNLCHALVDLYRRDAIAAPPDPELFFDAFRAPWRGAAYAAGRAVYGGD